MKKGKAFIAYLLIIIGLFLLLRQWKIPILTNFYSWQTILIIIGIILLLYSFLKGKEKYLFIGVITLGIGIHFYGMEHYPFWIHHWGIFPLIIGIAYIVKALKTKRSYIIGILFIIFGLVAIYSSTLNEYFYWMQDIFEIIKGYWPLLLIIVGIYMLKRKK